MKSKEFNYLRVTFRIISEKVNESDVLNAIDLNRLGQILDGSKKLLSQENSQELQINGKLDGETRWDRLAEVLDWAVENKAGLLKVRTNADIQLCVTAVCNVKNAKNPLLEKTREKLKNISDVEILFGSEAKETEPTN